VRFVTDTGKILPRKYTGLCAKHQRAVTRTIKHSRNMLLTK
jgi:small subunit ribosomal protein S18